MNLFVIGINHKTAPVEIREKFAFSQNEIIEANRLLKEEVSLSENLILSTCNRMEIYAVSELVQDYSGNIKFFLNRFHNLNGLDYANLLYIHKDRDAVKHLFRVAAGLDSMVIAETEILGQVKKAYFDAKESRSTGKILNRLFEKAFNTAKKIRTDTCVGKGSVSVSSLSVNLAKKILGDLRDKKILVIGAGAVGEQLVLYLKKNGIKTILVTNRTLEKTRSLTERFNAQAVDFRDFKDRLIDVDIVIASTGAPHCIIRKDDILSLIQKRKQKPLFIIDLAVPRDVEAEINKIDNVYLYNIDDLQRIVNENLNLRKSELDNCSTIVDTAAKRFITWLDSERIRDTEASKK